MSKGLAVKILVFLIIIWFLISAGKTLYDNWRVNKEVIQLKVEITELRKINEEMKDKILCYQSESYREKIARERFGLQKPGEEVVVIVPEKKPTQTEEEIHKNLSNPQRWWDYFFGG